MSASVSSAVQGISKAETTKRLKDLDKQTTADAKGKAFEDLVDYLFVSLGCRTKKNITSPLHAEQLDLAGIHLGALNPLPTFFIIECKYWEEKVSSAAVGYFLNTCRSRQTKLAIFFAKNGLTGTKAKQTAAHSVAFGGALEGICVVMVTLADIRKLTSNQDFANLLIDAWILAAAGAGIGMS